MKTALLTAVSLLAATAAAHAAPPPAPGPEIGSGLIGGAALVVGLLIAAAVMRFRPGVGER